MLSLQTNRRHLEKFAYSKGTNVALYHAERSDTYSRFHRKLEQALNSQIRFVTKNRQRFDTMVTLFIKSDTDDLQKEDQLMAELGHILLGKSIGDYVNLSAFLYWAGEQGGKAFNDKFNIQGTFALSNPEVLSYFDDYSKLRINTVDDYTKRWIAAKLKEGKAKMMNPNELIQFLIDEGKGIAKLRAERIVLTETARALIKVELEAAKRYGVKEKIWRTSVDDRVDPICVGLEGVKVMLNRSFPGGYDGPPAHVSCRCFIEEVIPSTFEISSNPWMGQ